MANKQVTPDWPTRMLSLALALGILTLFCQLVPGLTDLVIGVLDLRGWGYGAYSIFFATVLVILFVIRARGETRWQ